MFLSHTSELAEYPSGGSYIQRAKDAVIAAGHRPVCMEFFPATDAPPADYDVAAVGNCDVYVGIYGTRYGTPVPGRPGLSYTEQEFEAAMKAGMRRLLFLTDPESEELRLPQSTQDIKYGYLQQKFRERVRDSGSFIVKHFRNPDDLARLLERSLRKLEESQGLDNAGRAEPAMPAASRPQLHWLLPHLPNRHEQEQCWKALLKSLTSGKRKGPFLVISHGHENQEVDIFRDRLEHQILGKSFPGLSPFFQATGWPDRNQLGSQQPFALFLEATAELLSTSRPDAPLVLITTTHTHDWIHDRGDLMRRLFHFWHNEADCAGKPMIHWISIQYKTPELESPRLLRSLPWLLWLWPGYRVCRRLNRRIRASLASLSEGSSEDQLVILPEFQSIRRGDAEDWARSEAVRAGLGQSGELMLRLSKAVQSFYGHQGLSHIPMSTLSSHLKQQLQQLMR